jgi:hypothetical protein
VEKENVILTGDEKTIAESQFKLYTIEKKAKSRKEGMKRLVNGKEESMNKTSLKKEGKGGAESENKKDRIITRVNIGEISSTPRIKINCRVLYIEYNIPTIINNRGEDKP